MLCNRPAITQHGQASIGHSAAQTPLPQEPKTAPPSWLNLSWRNAMHTQQIPFDTVEDLSQFFLFALLSQDQQREVMAIEDRGQRHRTFAEMLRSAGYIEPA
jgi:rhodanese-related sulfurtransferase